MLQQLARLILAVAVWGLSTGIAQAVSLGKIEVTSNLGEPFYAEVPLMIDNGESLAGVQVGIASGDDYRILEVYRDPALNAIRVDVTSDSRGTRVELKSSNPIDAPFFNLVLKVKYDRATQFKKFPIFLDLPKAARAPAARQPLPTVKAVNGMAPAVSTAPAMVEPAATEVLPQAEEMPSAATPSHPFKPFDGWARIGRYGPMVYGDTISTVAERLRIDNRYSRQQVMVALFEKNRQKFDQDNINLIKAGTYLDVPTAAEVSHISPAEAHQVIAEHEKRWKELTKQPRYAAVEEAQRTRYSKRIRIGGQAAGMAPAPMAGEGQEKPSEAPQVAASATTAPAASAEAAAQAEQANAQIEQLNQQNQELETKLAESDKKIAELSGKLDEASAAAQNQARKKLELQVARLQSELDKARDQARAAEAPGVSWLTWVLGGAVVVLLGAIGFLLRREPKHPAMMGEEPVPSSSFDSSAIAETPSAEEEEEVPEIEVEEADIEAAASGIDFGDSTMRISPDQAAEYTDSIPDLTDEDTSEMEAFQEEVEEEPDPNVDYLSEADVYLRYGMEEEALQQAHMALKQNQFNPEAHIKMAQIQRQKGDEQAFEGTITSASSLLTGDALATFNDAIAELQAGEADASSLEDTMPPTEAAEMIGEDAERSAGEAGIDLESTLSELDNIDFGEMGTTPEETEAIVEEEPVVESAPAEVEAEEEEPEELSFDLSAADVGEGEEAEVEEVAGQAPEATGGGLDFDLSDIEVPEEAKPAAMEEIEPEVLTADLDKTVAIDWSQDTSIDSGELQISGESGASDMFEEESGTEEAPVAEAAEQETEEVAGISELDFDLETVDEEPAAAEQEITIAEPEAQAGSEEPDDGVTTLDLGTDDLDTGVDLSEIEVEAADDFTSTISTTLDEVSSADIDFTATGEHDLHKTEEAISFDEGKSAGSSGEDDLFDLDFGAEDADATQQLEDLLSEFSDEDNKKSDDKKDE